MQNYFHQVVPNENFTNPYQSTWAITSTDEYEINFGNVHYSNVVTIFTKDIDMKTINVEKTPSCIGIEILANGLVEEDIKVFTEDGKLVVEFLEEDREEYEYETILKGFSQQCGKVEFEFSHLYDYTCPKIDLILGTLYIAIPKFEEFLKQEIEF